MAGLSRFVSFFANEGNGRLGGGIERAEGVMKQRESKKQPSRHDYALALKTIRAQFQTIESQGNTIHRQNQFMVMIWMDGRTPPQRKKPEEETGEQSPNRWIN